MLNIKGIKLYNVSCIWNQLSCIWNQLSCIWIKLNMN
jgi:hypothetical protein